MVHPVAQADAVRRDLVHQRLAAADHAVDALADVRRDVGVGQPSLQILPAGVELGQRGLGISRRSNSPASRRRARPCSSRSRAPFRRGRRRGANRRPRSRSSRCAIRRTSPARTSGTKTIANTFQRTGQFAIDHRDGRLAGRCASGSKSTIVPIRLLQLRERGHRRPPLLSAACPQFSNGASFIGLPADLPSMGGRSTPGNWSSMPAMCSRFHNS